MTVGRLTEGEIVKAFHTCDEIENIQSKFADSITGLTLGFNAIKRLTSNSAIILSGGYDADPKETEPDNPKIYAVLIVNDLSGIHPNKRTSGTDCAFLHSTFDFLANYIAVPFSWSPSSFPSLRQTQSLAENFNQEWLDKFVTFGDQCMITTYLKNGVRLTSQFSFYKYQSWFNTESQRRIDIDRFRRLKLSLDQSPEKSPEMEGPSEFLIRKCSELEELISRKETREEHVHQWLYRPEHSLFLDLDAVSVRSKVSFGKFVSDFVVCRSNGTYNLIEIESPHMQLFQRASGEKTSALNHAISQTRDWEMYIRRNLRTVQYELDLKEIYEPDTTVLGGRTSSIISNLSIDRWRDEQRLMKPFLSTYDEAIQRVRELANRLKLLPLLAYQEPGGNLS